MKTARLGELADLIRGITYKPGDCCDYREPGAFACMRTKNVQADLDESDLVGIPRSVFKSEEKIINEGDILVSSANSWNLVGKCCWVPKLTYPATAGGFISILRSKSRELDSRFLYRWFSSAPIQAELRSFGNQTTNISNLDHKRSLALEIPLPPPAAQKRIAGILDTADALRAKRREALAQLDSLLQSSFLDLFGDPVSNPMGWGQVELGDLVADNDRINYGVIQPGGEYPGGRPLIRVGDFVGGELDLSEIKFIDPKIDAQYERSRLLGTELLVSCVGSIGTVCRVPKAAEGHNIARAVARVPLGPKVEREFMLFCLRSAGVQNYFTSETRTVSQPTLNIGLIKTATVTVPPLPLQRRFAAIVESVERQKVRQRGHLAELDALFAALQHQAFRGEL